MQINTKINSPNYSTRNSEINFIIIHYTEMTFEGAIERLCNSSSGVSCHYLIKVDGQIFQLVDDQYKAWHAGESSWKEIQGLNDSSIGIELDNMGHNFFSVAQMNSCIDLCQKLVYVHNIPRSNILGHSDIAPARKIDPGVFFEWQYLAKYKLGLWHNIDAVYAHPKTLFQFGDNSSEILVLQSNLKKLGYMIQLTGVFDEQTNFVIRSFQAHFYSKLIRRHSMDFYHSNHSKYSWDSVSDKMLQNMLNL